MTRPFVTWAATAALLLAVPPAGAVIFVAVQSELHLLDAADRIIAELDAAEAAFVDMEPEDDDDALEEASLQRAVMCPDVQPLRRLRGGRA